MRRVVVEVLARRAGAQQLRFFTSSIAMKEEDGNGRQSGEGSAAEQGQGSGAAESATEEAHCTETDDLEKAFKDKLSFRKPVLLVLDLNGLLVIRKRRPNMTMEDFKMLGKEGGPVKISEFFFAWRRPHALEFVEFLFENFEIAVWSSARKHNVEDILQIAMTKVHQGKLVDVLHQSDCIQAGTHPHEDKSDRACFVKQLDVLWKRHPRFSGQNTLLIDDSLYKVVLNPENTAIHPKTWDGNPDDNFLSENGSLRTYLKKLRAFIDQSESTSVQDFVARNLFETGFSAEEWKLEEDHFRIINDRINQKGFQRASSRH